MIILMIGCPDDLFLVNFSTTSLFDRALGIMFFDGKSSPLMAELFRVVKYCNLPRINGALKWVQSDTLLGIFEQTIV